MNIPNTERLTFTFATNEHADLLFELDQDEVVMEHLNGGKKTSRQKIEQVFLPRLASYSNKSKGWGIWLVSLNDQQGVTDISERFLGWILVRPMDFFSDTPQLDNLELGWRFKQSSWGMGIATEAARAVADSLIQLGAIHTLSAITVPANIGSIGVMKKLGMTFDKKAMHKDPLGDIEAIYYSCSV